MNNTNEYGLVLSGGGTKGAFEMGVWEALREMNISTPCVIGTSIGAINTAVIAQNDFDAALDFWSNLTINQVLKLNTEMTNRYVEKWSKMSFDFFRISFFNDLFRGGLDISPLRENLSRLISEEKIRKSPIRLGLVTVRLNTLSPVQLMIEDIPEGKLLDYLLASAALPIFQRQEIDGSTYLDGGFYDNVPINFMAEKGYKNIIVVDFPALGFKQQVKRKDLKLTHINNSEYLGMTLEFDQSTIVNNIEMGYLDTLKTFGVVSGKHYYFDLSQRHQFYDRLEACIGTPLEDTTSREKVAQLLSLSPTVDKPTILTAIQNLVRSTNYPEDEPLLLTLMEITGKALGVKRMEKYTRDQFFPAILNALNQLTQTHLELIKNDTTVQQVFKESKSLYKPATILDFITFYVLFIGARKDMPLPRLQAMLRKMTPEFTLAIVFLIYLHQAIKEK